MFARECLIESSVDVTVRGQGEETFADIVQRLAQGRSLEDCAGCTVRLADGTIRENPARPLAQVDKFRAHDYGLIPVERYYELKGKRQLDYISSQGCNFRCAFCSDPFVYGRKWVGLEPVRMAMRLKELWDRYQFDDVNFQDETFFTKADRVEALADRIVESGMKITWAATMRADQGVRLPHAVWAALQAIGPAPPAGRRRVRLQRGAEAHPQGHQDRAGVRDRGEDAQYGIAGHFPFIVGFPDESDESIQASLDCAKKLRSMSPDFLTPIYYFKPYPGSALVIEAVERGFRLPETLRRGRSSITSPASRDRGCRRRNSSSSSASSSFTSSPGRRCRPARGCCSGLARYRCNRNNYRWPVEMLFTRWLAPAQKLS